MPHLGPGLDLGRSENCRQRARLAILESAKYSRRHNVVRQLFCVPR